MAANPERTARILQRTANGLCYARMIAGPLLGLYIAKQPEYRSWKTAGLIGLLSATDALDGKLARRAIQLDPTIANQRGAWLDQMADKIFTHGILGGMVIHAMRNKQQGLTPVLAASQAIQLGRDAWVTSVRKRASEHDVATNAQLLGKIKTGTLLASTIAMASPLAITPETGLPMGQLASGMGLTLGSGLAVASGISLVNNLETAIAASSQNEPNIYENTGSATELPIPLLALDS